MKQQFEQIYATNLWKFGSGEGSLPVHTAEYRRFLEEFLRARKISSVVDFGCGDWQFSRLIDWNGALYNGFDIVPTVIEANRTAFGRENVGFHCFSGDFALLPSADLLIVKDVLQHWSNQAIFEFLPVLKRYRFCLITNCVSRVDPTVNRDISDGDFRPLDIRWQPFNVAAEEVFTFTNKQSFVQRLLRRPRWKKRVLLITTKA